MAQAGIYKITQLRRTLLSSVRITTAFVALNLAASAAYAQDAEGDQSKVTTLAPISVTGKTNAQTGSSGSDNSKIAAKNSNGATKIATPLVETPRSVSVVTKKEMDERAAHTITDAVAYTAGVQTGVSGYDPRFEEIVIRGNDVTETGDYLDGLNQPYMNYGMFRTDPYALERAEVVKGPVSVLYGAGNLGGIVNKIPKLATDESIHEVGVVYGTADRAQTMFDFGGRISPDDDRYLYRIVGLARNGNTNFNIADDRYFIQPSFTWKPDDSTSFTLYGQAGKDETDANVGALIGPNGQVLKLRESDPHYDYQKTEQQQIGYKFEHDFDNGLTFRQNVRYSHLNLNARYLTVDQSSWVGTVAQRYATSVKDQLNVFQVDNQLEAKFDTGPASHTMLFGADYTNVTSAYGYGVDPNNPAYAFDIAHPTYGVSGTTPSYNNQLLTNDLWQVGGYALEQMELDKWRFSLGGRETWVGQKTDTTDVTSGSETLDKLNKHAFSTQAGVVYLFDNGIAPYVSYATSFQPVTQRSVSGDILQPTKGEQFEGGVKYQPPGTDILLTASLYHLVEKNKPVLVDPVALVYDSLGEVTNNGVELEAKANIATGLDLTASYAYNHAEITGGTNVGNAPSETPRNMASLWSHYSFDEGSFGNGFSIGGGIRYVGSSYTSTDNTAKNGQAVYFDASLSYDFGALDQKYKGLTASFNVQNIADKRNTVCSGGYCYLAQGRNVTATLKYRW